VNQDINDLFEDDMQSENDKDRNITIDIKHTLSTNIPEDSSPEDNIEFFGGDIEDLKNEIDLELKDNNFIEVPEYLSPMLNNLIKNVEAIKDLDEDIIHYDVCDICMSIEDILNFDFRHSVLITKTLWSWIRDRLPSCVPKSRAATIITFINGLSDLTEDLGRFRAFLRWTLNEQSCSFFFNALLYDSDLSNYFLPTALVCNSDANIIFLRELEKLSKLQFNITINNNEFDSIRYYDLIQEERRKSVVMSPDLTRKPRRKKKKKKVISVISTDIHDKIISDTNNEVTINEVANNEVTNNEVISKEETNNELKLPDVKIDNNNIEIKNTEDNEVNDKETPDNHTEDKIPVNVIREEPIIKTEENGTVPTQEDSNPSNISTEPYDSDVENEKFVDSTVEVDENQSEGREDNISDKPALSRSSSN